MTVAQLVFGNGVDGARYSAAPAGALTKIVDDIVSVRTSRCGQRRGPEPDLWLQAILLHNLHKGAEIDGLMDYSLRFNIAHKPAARYDHYGNRSNRSDPIVTLLLREEFPTHSLPALSNPG